MIQRSDIFKRMKSRMTRLNHKLDSKHRIESRIISMYFKILFTNVISGSKWVLPSGFGTMFLHYEYPKNIHAVNRRKRFYHTESSTVSNPKTGGRIYSIRINGKYQRRLMFRFRAANKWRMELFNSLYY